MIITKEKIEFGNIPEPSNTAAIVPVDLTEETMRSRKERVLERMKEERIDFLFIYSDREHGGNFGYLTGFEPRFEEAVLVLHSNGDAYLLLGNESTKMGKYSRIKAKVIHFPYFSLPNQPMGAERGIDELLKEANIQNGACCGFVGWKMFTSHKEDNTQIFDVPFFLVERVRRIIGEEGKSQNAVELMIAPENGVRIINNDNEIAHFEYGASQASSKILALLNEVALDKTELELADNLAIHGQPFSTQPICATGQRFTNAIVAPRNKKIKRGDRFSASMGLRGGLTCRTGYVVSESTELPEHEKNYLERVAKPYYAAISTWYSSIKIGIEAGEIYDMIEAVIPQNKYGWELNPGHFTASEEWLSSPFYPESKIILKSGMMFQMDIIISVEGMHGANAEDGVVLADEELREAIKVNYPEMWQRMERRRKYMKEVLKINIHEELLPMSIMNGYLRPFLLSKDNALRVKE